MNIVEKLGIILFFMGIVAGANRMGDTVALGVLALVGAVVFLLGHMADDALVPLEEEPKE